MSSPLFRAERAVSAARGSASWVVVDEGYQLHVEASAFLAGLRASGRSVNTERVYAGRTALFLSWSAQFRVRWACPRLTELARFLRWLVDEPLPGRGRHGPAAPRYRSANTANAVMGTTCEFLRFSARNGWTPAELAAQLAEPRYLAYLPPGFDVGEVGQFRTVRTRTLKLASTDAGIEWLSADQVARLAGAATNDRDRFLVLLLWCTGMRIGEALGLHRQDMHLLASSEALGCQIAGPHVHVRRRVNANGVWAKSRRPRPIPVTADLVEKYARYCHLRDEVAQAQDSDLVFVNLFREPLGGPMTYSNAKDLFDRLSARAGLVAHPHMLRHGAATRWIRDGVARDTVQELLGHVSPASMTPYLHASDEDKRAAVENVASGRGQDRERQR